MFDANVHGLYSGLHTLAVAASQRPGMTGDEAAGCAACGALASGAILIPIAIVVLNIVLLIWVARDAKARGIDNSVMWVILVAVASVIGLVIYLASRPSGMLVVCAVN